MEGIQSIPGSSVGRAALPNADGIQQPGAEQIPVNPPPHRAGSTLQADPNFIRRGASSPRPLSSFASTAFSSLADDVISLAAFEKRLASILSLPACLRIEPLNALYGRLECLPINEVRAATDLLLAGARNVSEPLPYRLRTTVESALIAAATRSLENGATAEHALGTFGRHRGVDVRDHIKLEIGLLAMKAISNGESIESVVDRLSITDSDDIAILRDVAARSVQRNNS